MNQVILTIAIFIASYLFYRIKLKDHQANLARNNSEPEPKVEKSPLAPEIWNNRLEIF